LKLRRRRWLTPAQGWSASDNPGIASTRSKLTLKGFAKKGTLSGFKRFSFTATQGSRWRSNPGLKLANAFGVFHQISNLSLIPAQQPALVIEAIKQVSKQER